LTAESQQSGPELNFLVLLETVFDKKHNSAVVKYLPGCGERDASGTTRVMEKVQGKWVASLLTASANLIVYQFAPRCMSDQRSCRTCGFASNSSQIGI
jgi:hypothetical protein